MAKAGLNKWIPLTLSCSQELSLGERLALFWEIYQTISTIGLQEAAGLIL